MIRIRLTSLARLLPSGLREPLYRARLRKQLRIVPIAPQHEQRITRSTFGQNCRISTRTRIQASHVDDFTLVQLGCEIDNARIGKFCSLAKNAWVGTGPHPTDQFVSTHMFFYAPYQHLGYAPKQWFFDNAPTTTVGHDVWVGTGACVLGGVTIGHGAVIGAGSVVTHDVPPYAIYAGTPARFVRHRFDDATIRFLLELQWWHFDHDWLRAHYRLFHDVNQLRQAMQPALSQTTGPRPASATGGVI
jgi:acetyltransferase-like isoleucine patch superfamily enzyme